MENLPKEIFFEERIGTNGIKCLDYKNETDIKYIRVDFLKDKLTEFFEAKLIDSHTLGRKVIFENQIEDICDEILNYIK